MYYLRMTDKIYFLIIIEYSSFIKYTLDKANQIISINKK